MFGTLVAKIESIRMEPPSVPETIAGESWSNQLIGREAFLLTVSSIHTGFCPLPELFNGFPSNH